MVTLIGQRKVEVGCVKVGAGLKCRRNDDGLLLKGGVMSKSKVLTLVSSELLVAYTRTEDVLENSLLKIQKAHNTSHTSQSFDV